MVKVKSDRGVKRAIELIDELLKDVRKRPEYEAEDFSIPTYTDDELVGLGLAKYSNGAPGVMPEIAATENKAADEEFDTEVIEGENQKDIIRIRKSFKAKLSQTSDENKRFYNEVKNYLLSYKRVHSRISWSTDSFNLGKDYVAKIMLRGKTLVLFLALDPDQYIDDKKYHVKNMRDIKKFEYTPSMVKIKSDRGVKRAIELIDVVLKDDRKRPEYEAEDFTIPTYSDKKLIQMGLAKYGKSKF